MVETEIRGSTICKKNMANVDLETYYISRLEKKDIVRFNVTVVFCVLSLLILALVNSSNLPISLFLLACSLSVLFWGISFRKRFREIEVRGNILIISDGKDSITTAFKGIKKITSKKLLNLKFTFVYFHLDGKNHSIVLISPIHHRPGKLLTELKQKKADL